MGFIARYANWKSILPFFLVFCLFTFFLFPYYQTKITSTIGQEIKPLDVRFHYSYDDVKKDFHILGTEGRRISRIITGRMDMIYPVVYGTLFLLLIGNLVGKVAKPSSILRFTIFLPVAGVLFDYLENFNTLKLLNQFPDISENTVSYGETMTQLKHVTLFLSVGLIIALFIIRLIRGKKPGIVHP